jgi:HEAT repeat protein
MKYSAKVDKLLNYAVFDFSEDWSDYLALGFTEEDVPALLQLAQDKEALQYADDLVSSAPFHAWRVLGLLKAEAAVLPLFAAFGDDDWSSEEIPSILGLIGEKTIEPIKQHLFDPNR